MKTQTLLSRWCALVALAACLLVSAARADIIHQYGFNQPSTDVGAQDFISLADGILVNGVAFENTNVLHFFGTNGYLDLPNGIISSLTDATFETWVTWHGGDNWQRLFDFGTGTGGENPTTNVTGTGYMFFTPKSSSGTARFGIRRTNDTAENLILDGPVLPTNVMTHVAISYSPTKGIAKLYINGQFVSQGVATQPLNSLEDVNNWLGRSQFTADTNLNASLDEFRIYDTALSPAEVAASYSGGSSNNSTFPGTLTGVRLVTPSTLLSFGTAPATAFADYSIVTNVNVSTFEGAVYASSDTNVLTVTSNGVMRGVASGTANVTVTYQGFSDVKSVQVIYPYVNALKHRYSFAEVSGTTVTDSIAGSNGTLVNPSNFSTFSGGGLILSNLPNIGSGAVGSYVDLPNGLISTMTNATFETWVTFYAIAGGWQRIWDLGTSTGGENVSGSGSSYILLTPRTGTGGGTRFSIRDGAVETSVLDAPQLAANQEAHIVVTYSTNLGARLYVNGQFIQARPATTPLSAIVDVNNWLGRSQWSGDHYFNGRYNEFRIHHGLLSEGDVRASYLGGPNIVTNAGVLQSIQLLVNQATMSGGAQTAAVLGTYQYVTNVNLTLAVETIWASSDTNVVVAISNGLIQAVGPGTATVFATYQGATASNTVTVVSNAGPANLLVNRYSFDEGAGTNIIDSIGGAHGVVVNPTGTNFLWTGTNLWLNNRGNNAATNAFVDLPNGIISRHTNITIEAWVTWANNFADNWTRIFDFGNSTGAEGTSGTGRSYFLLTPRSGGTGNRMRVTISTNSNAAGAERIMEPPFNMAQNTEVHVAVVYNASGKAMTLYTNGVRVANAASEVPIRGLTDVNVWLGRAQYGDPFFNGRYNEFRIFSEALTDRQVASNYLAGPNANFDIPVSIVVQPRNVTAGQGANAIFSVAGKGFPAISYQWYVANTLVPNATNQTFTLPTVSLGDSGTQVYVVLSNMAANVSTVVTSTVATLTVVNAADSLAHRYSFATNANDSVGTAHGTLYGAAAVTNGSLVLNGTAGTYLDLPGGLLNGLSAVTIEFWATYGVNNNWSRVFDFGMTNGTAGNNYVFFSPHSGAGGHRLAITDSVGANENLIEAPGVFDGRTVHVACVIDSTNNFMAIYTNGVLESASFSIVRQLATVSNLLSYVGRSLYAGDAYLNASIDEFRIYNSALSAGKVQQSYAQGTAVPLNNNALTIAQQPVTQRPVLGGTATFSVTAVSAFGLPAPSYQWRSNGVNIAGANASTLSLSNVTVSFIANYDVIVTNTGLSLTSTVATIVINGAPVANTDQLFTATNTTWTFAATNLLGNDTDPDGDSISVSSVTNLSTNAAAIIYTNGVIAYVPVANYSGADAFTYVIIDSAGATATGTVTVQVLAQPAGGTGVTVSLSGGVALVTFVGIPNTTYTIQRTVAVPGGWGFVGTATADSTGKVSFSDPNPPSGQAFYRMLKP